MPQNPPEGSPHLIPYLHYNDVGAALDWLAKAYGFSQRMVMPGPEGKIMHAEMDIADGSFFMLGPASDETGTKSPHDIAGVNQALFCYVDDVDTHFAEAKAAGATITQEPTDMFWGDRMYNSRDCEGHHWSFATHVRDVAPEDMKPPGA